MHMHIFYLFSDEFGETSNGAGNLKKARRTGVIRF